MEYSKICKMYKKLFVWCLWKLPKQYLIEVYCYSWKQANQKYIF